MTQKLLSMGDDYYIRDAQGNDVYFVDGKAFTIGDQLSFQDLEQRELAYIKQTGFLIGRTYEISRNGAVVAIVKQELFTPFHHRFTIGEPGHEDLECEGDLLDHEYIFRRGDRSVATVSKQWFTFTDTYGIEIAEGEDDLLILASAVVVDEVCHPDGRRR